MIAVPNVRASFRKQLFKAFEYLSV